MGEGKLRRAVVIAGLLLLGLLAGCTEGLSIAPNSGGSTANSIPVDTVFKEFYQALGGMEILGPAISSLEIRNNQQCQYVERALMCFDPLAADASNRFSLYPLGLELGVLDGTMPSGAVLSPGARVVDGYAIYDKFLPMYDRLFGARYAGRPLTEVRINQDLQRLEQFFENVGFYQNLNDPNGEVHLIAYGAYLCGSCASQLDEYWSIVKSTMIDQPFAGQVTRLGGTAVFGSLLLKPRAAEDGSIEQAYDNAVFYAPPENLNQARLRPLPSMLNYETQPPQPQISHENLVYYEINGGLGHNVPRPFDSFIATHGGRDLSGNPISEVILLQNGIFRQCFEYYCLIYDPSAEEAMRVRLAPLGKEYIQRYPPADDLQIQNIFSPDQIDLFISADRPTLNVSDQQTIRMVVQQKGTGQPIERVEGTVVVYAPGKPAQRYAFGPTDAGGMSTAVIPAQPDLTNGSRLVYEVCLNLPSEQPICARDSYLLWNLAP
jgi:hypothetical protein